MYEKYRLFFALICVSVLFTSACSRNSEPEATKNSEPSMTNEQASLFDPTDLLKAIFEAQDPEQAPSYYAFDIDASTEALIEISESLFDAKLTNEGAYRTRQGKLVKPPLLELEYPVNGVQLGQGWHINENIKAQSQCIDFSIESAGGQHVELDYQQVFSSDELSRSMNTTIQASGKGSYAGVSGKASYKSQISKTVNVESSAQTHLLSATVIDGIEFVAPQDQATQPKIIGLSDFAKRLLSEKGLDAFQAHCGQAYVSNIQRGAELYLIMQKFNSEVSGSSSNEQALSGEVSYLSFSAQASAESKSLESFLQSSGHSSFTYYHSAHSGLSIPSDISDIAKTVQALGGSSSSNPSFPFQIQLMRYSELPDYQSILDELPTIMFERQQVYVNRLTSINNTLEHMLDYSLFVKGSADQYRACQLKDTNCAQYDNLSLYYHPISNIAAWTEAERQRFIQLQSIIEKDIINVNAHIDYCAMLKEDSEACIAQYDGKYNDYFYRALLPLKKNQQTFTSEGARNSADKLANEIDALSKLYQNAVAYTTTKEECKKFLGLIKHHCKDVTTEYKCPKNKQHPICKAQEQNLKKLKAQQAETSASTEVASHAQMRLFYLIEDTMKRRAEDGAIDYHLNDSELAYLAQDIACQNAVYAGLAQCATHIPIWHLLQQSEEPLKFTYTVDFERHKQKLDYQLSALLNNAKAQYMKAFNEQAQDQQAPLMAAPSEESLAQISTFASLQSRIDSDNKTRFTENDLVGENNAQSGSDEAVIDEYSESETLQAWLRMGVRLEQVLTEHKENIDSPEHPIALLTQIDAIDDLSILDNYLAQLAEKSRLPMQSNDNSPTIVTPNFALFSLEEDFALQVRSY